MKIKYTTSIKHDIDQSTCRHEKYKDNIKRKIEREFPDADVTVVDTNNEDSSLNIDFSDRQASMDIYDQIKRIIDNIEY